MRVIRRLSICLLLLLFAMSCKARFAPRVVDTYHILIASFTVEDGALVPVSSQIAVQYNGECVLMVECDAGTSVLELREGWETLTFIAIKHGFSSCEKELTRQELVAYEATPLTFNLTPESP